MARLSLTLVAAQIRAYGLEPTPSACANVLAMLDTIAWSEIKPALLAQSDDGYNLIVGSLPGHAILFGSYADHPRRMMTFTLRSGATINTTAAGRYMYLSRTWDGLQRKLLLPDFSPANQDRACLELLHQGGALPHLMAGSIPMAFEVAASIARENATWASLPGAGYGQPENKLFDLLRVYGAALAHYESLPQALGL